MRTLERLMMILVAGAFFYTSMGLHAQCVNNLHSTRGVGKVSRNAGLLHSTIRERNIKKNLAGRDLASLDVCEGGELSSNKLLPAAKSLFMGADRYLAAFVIQMTLFAGLLLGLDYFAQAIT
jgi:hypothetical protein